jgi:glutathione S-transferase
LFKGLYVSPRFPHQSPNVIQNEAETIVYSGIPPNKEGMQYTIPAVRIPNHDPEHIMDSKAIAIALEEKHPSPPLHLDSSVLPKVEAAVGKIMPQMAPIIMPRIPRDILNDKSRGYFEETREKRFGMPLHVLEKEKGGEQAWENATPALMEMASLLNETKGLFFMGEEVSYADMVVAGFFRFIKRAGEDIFERVMKVDPSFPTLYEASGPWLERSKH